MRGGGGVSGEDEGGGEVEGLIGVLWERCGRCVGREWMRMGRWLEVRSMIR